MSYKDEQISKYVNNVYHLNEKNAVARQIDALRKAGKSEDEIRANPVYAQELDRQASNINVKDNFDKVSQAKDAADRAQDRANLYQTDKFDMAADKARANVSKAEQDLEAAKAQAKINAEQNRQAREDARLADIDAYNAEKKEKAENALLFQKGKDAIVELEQTKKELEQAKKELEELKAKAAQGDLNAAKEAEKVEEVVDQKTEEVKEEQAEVEAITPPTAEELNTGAETTTTQTSPEETTTPPEETTTSPEETNTSPEETANAQATAEAAATQSAMEIKPTDTPEIQQAKQNFQQEWADLKTQIGSIQDTTKKLMASPIATSYVKQRPDLATKFQKFGGALAAMGSIVGLAGMITMFINPALGGILSAAGRTMVGAGGATASGANAVKQFKNGNVLGGIGSLAAAGMSGAMAGMGAKSLAGNIGTMQAANTAPAVSSGTTDVMAGDPRFAAPADANPTNGNATQSFTPGSNPAQFTNREPTIANTNDAVANAQPGDVLQRNDGTRIEINQGDIDWAKAHQAQPTPQVTPQVGAQTLANSNVGTLNLSDYNAFKNQIQPNSLFNSSVIPHNPNLGNIKVPQGVLQPNFLNDYNAYKAQPSMNLSQGVNIGGNNPPNWVPSSWSQPHQLAPNVSFPYVNTVGNIGNYRRS